MPVLSKQVGEEVQMPCALEKAVNSGADWLYQKHLSTAAHHIISGGHLLNGDRNGRLRIDGSTLCINNVNADDAGIYICVEQTGLGTDHRINLTVLGQFSVRIFLTLLAKHKQLFTYIQILL